MCGGEAGEGTLTGDQESLLSNLHKSQQQQQPTLQSTASTSTLFTVLQFKTVLNLNTGNIGNESDQLFDTK